MEIVEGAEWFHYVYLLRTLIACDNPLAPPTRILSLKGALETSHSLDLFLDPLSSLSVSIVRVHNTLYLLLILVS